MSNDKSMSKKERKEFAKEQKRKERAKRTRLRVLAYAGIGLVAALAIGLIAYRLLTRPGEAVPSLGREHVRASVEVSYNSTPPTSGPHTSRSMGPGIYDEAPDDKPLVHSLEHGYVIVSYNCAESDMPCAELQGLLEETAREKDLWKLIVTPRADLDVPIALTAWTRIDKLEEFDRRRIERFIDVWRDRGPEDTPN